MEAKKGLGRGLASLIPQAAPSEVVVLASQPQTVSENTAGLLEINPALIEANPDQPRRFFDEEKIRTLADSLREHGFLHPLVVIPQGEGESRRYQLISGERRLRAARLLGLEKVPVLLRTVAPAERLELALIENIQRADLDPIEEAQAYQELVETHGMTQEQVADRVAKDRATVANMIRLLKLPSAIRQALQAGMISVGHARALLGVPEIERQLYFLTKIGEEGWSVRELEARIGSKRKGGLVARIRNMQPLSPLLMRLRDDWRRKLGTQVRILPSGKKGKILIDYYSEEDLERFHKLLGA